MGKLCVGDLGIFLNDLDTDEASREKFIWARGYGGHGLRGELRFMTELVVVELGRRPNPRSEIKY